MQLHAYLNWSLVAVFVTVYVGMVLGGLPRLKLNRSGVALLGAISVIGLGGMSPRQAVDAVDLPTVMLLFAFMVISAQMRLGGFYTAVTERVVGLALGRNALLGVIIAVAGALSAVFSNDVVCLAMTPLVAQLCHQRRIPPVPFLLGLACAANIGSAATLIGNPQNMLIGSVMLLPFGAYLRQALPPVGLSLLLLWVWLVWGLKAQRPISWNEPALGSTAPENLRGRCAQQVPEFDRWQTLKGLLVAGTLMGVFLLTDWPREVAALVGAGLLLLSSRLHSSHVMEGVDWQLLVLFMGLFVVNHAFASTGLAAQSVAWLGNQGVRLGDPGVLFAVGVGLSNLVSNVPAVMLLLPHLEGFESGLMLALVSTLAGNLLLVGSIANLIVVDLARDSGVAIDWRMHAKVGVPVTLLTLAVVWGWLQLTIV